MQTWNRIRASVARCRVWACFGNSTVGGLTQLVTAKRDQIGHGALTHLALQRAREV